MQSVPLGSKKHKNWEMYANHFFMFSQQVTPKNGGEWSPMITHFAVESQRKPAPQIPSNEKVSHQRYPTVSEQNDVILMDYPIDARLKIDYLID